VCSQELAGFRYELLAALAYLDLAGRFQQFRDVGVAREFPLQASQQGDAIVAAPAGQESPRFPQTLQSALIGLVSMNLVQELGDLVVIWKLLLDLNDQGGTFVVPARREQAARFFQALTPALFGLLFARSFQQPENFFLMRKFLL
jgi:hypothetical protein